MYYQTQYKTKPKSIATNCICYEIVSSKAFLTKSNSIEIDFKVFYNKKQETPNAIEDHQAIDEAECQWKGRQPHEGHDEKLQTNIKLTE